MLDTTRGIIEQCPIRAEFPLSLRDRGRWAIGVLARVRCNEAYANSLALERSGSTLAIRPWIALPRGQDQWIDIKLWLYSEGVEVAKTSFSLPGDEGEMNWGDPIVLRLPRAIGTEARLRVEMGFRPRD